MTDAPRIPPLPPGEEPPEVAPALDATIPGGGRLGDNNIFRTLARHPKLFGSWLPFGGRLLGGGTLPARDRELAILRTAVRCRSSYEWGQHVRIGLAAGLSREEVDRVVAGPDAEGWDEHDAAVLRAVDELHERSDITDVTWAALARSYDERELIELTMLIGHYHMVAFALSSLRVPLDDGLEPLPDGAG